MVNEQILNWSDASLKRLYVAIFGSSVFYHKDNENVRYGLPYAVSTLPSRLVAVLFLRYEKCMTLRAVGELLPNESRIDGLRGTFGVNPERVRQLEGKALRLMRHPSRTKLFIYKVPKSHPLPIGLRMKKSTSRDIQDTWNELSNRFKQDWQCHNTNYNAMVLGFR
jgi:hypothetical protein